jgi:polysaccharide export outer membrane protein
MSHTRRLVLVTSVTFLLAGLGVACSSPATAPPPPVAATYRIGPPDRLDISILPDPAISRSVTVRPDGMISVDLVGDIPAAGRTTTEVAKDIQNRISRYKRDAVVTVSLSAAASTEITVFGEVGSQRTFPIQRETRLIEALGQVGGVGMMADKDNIRIIRLQDGQSHIYYADLSAIEVGDLSTNYLLQGGDVIIVPPTTSAKIGYAVQAFTFPITQILGFGARITNMVLMP